MATTATSLWFSTRSSGLRELARRRRDLRARRLEPRAADVVEPPLARVVAGLVVGGQIEGAVPPGGAVERVLPHVDADLVATGHHPRAHLLARLAHPAAVCTYTSIPPKVPQSQLTDR